MPKIPEFRENIQGRPRAIDRREIDGGTEAYVAYNFATKEEFEELQKYLEEAVKEQNNLLLEILKQVSMATKHQAAMSDEDVDESDIEVNN